MTRLSLSSDTVRSANLEVACVGGDILVHDALQPALVDEVRIAMETRGNANAAAILADIQDYHASPEQAAEHDVHGAA